MIINVECRLCSVLFMLSVANKPFMLSVILLNVNMMSVVILNVVAPQVEIAWKNVQGCLSER